MGKYAQVVRDHSPQYTLCSKFNNYVDKLYSFEF